MFRRIAVHTDEFEISLSRELNVCKNTIQRTQKSLGLLEQKHNKITAVFIEEASERQSSGSMSQDENLIRITPGNTEARETFKFLNPNTRSGSTIK